MILPAAKDSENRSRPDEITAASWWSSSLEHSAWRSNTAYNS